MHLACRTRAVYLVHIAAENYLRLWPDWDALQGVGFNMQWPNCSLDRRSLYPASSAYRPTIAAVTVEKSRRSSHVAKQLSIPTSTCLDFHRAYAIWTMARQKGVHCLSGRKLQLRQFHAFPRIMQGHGRATISVHSRLPRATNLGL